MACPTSTALLLLSSAPMPACLPRPAVPCRACAPLPVQILVNPADPSSHIYKANAQGDTARCALLTLLLVQSRGS
jgi:hypothetical protein